MKTHDKDTRSRSERVRRQRVRQSKPFQLSDEEQQLIDRPEVPLEQWRKGEALLGSKLERLTIELVGRRVANNSATNKVKADKSELRKRIANDPLLTRDFEFFTKKLGWGPEGLLQHLYWDCDMMHATPQTVVAREKRNHWPMDRTVLDALCDDISKLAAKLEKLSQTEFSPARTVILREETGDRLPPARERYFLKAFRELPEILRFYRRDLNRKVLNTAAYWSKAAKDWESLVEGSREHSLYEKIRARAGKYHASHLHRLVNAARQAHSLSPIEWYAFRKWLSELKQRLEKAKAQSPSLK